MPDRGRSSPAQDPRPRGGARSAWTNTASAPPVKEITVRPAISRFTDTNCRRQSIPGDASRRLRGESSPGGGRGREPALRGARAGGPGKFPEEVQRRARHRGSVCREKASRDGAALAGPLGQGLRRPLLPVGQLSIEKASVPTFTTPASARKFIASPSRPANSVHHFVRSLKWRS